MIVRIFSICFLWCISVLGLLNGSMAISAKSLRESQKEKSIVNELIQELVLLDMLENSNSSATNSTGPTTPSTPGGSFSFSTFLPTTIINLTPFTPGNSVPYPPPNPPPVGGGGPPPSNAPDVQFCREFRSSNTANSTINTCQCNVDACAGEIVSVKACHCQGPVKLRFYEVSSMSELQPSDYWVDYDFCDNGCPTYGFRNNFAFPCRQFGIVGGCEGNAACSTRVAISVYPSSRRLLMPHYHSVLSDKTSHMDHLLTKEEEEELSRTAEVELQLLHSLEAEAALEAAARAIYDEKSLVEYVHMLYAPHILNDSFNINDTRNDDHDDRYLGYTSPLPEDDDEYFNTPFAYLDTVCKTNAYGTDDTDTLTLSSLLFIVVISGAICLVLVGLCLVWWFRPQKLYAWKIYLQSGCVSMLYSTGFHASYFFYLYNQSESTVVGRTRGNHSHTISVAPVTTTVVQMPSVVDLTPVERDQGFFRPNHQIQPPRQHHIDPHLLPSSLITTSDFILRHSEQKFNCDDPTSQQQQQQHFCDEDMQTLSSSPGKMKPQPTNNDNNNNNETWSKNQNFIARFSQLCNSLFFGGDVAKIQPIHNYAEEDEDNEDDNVSEMGELEDDDPRVLKKLAKKQQRLIAESQHLHHSLYSRHAGGGGVGGTINGSGSGRIGSYHHNTNAHSNTTTDNPNTDTSNPNNPNHLSKLTPDQFFLLLSPPSTTEDACSVPGSVRSFHSHHTPGSLHHQHSATLFSSNNNSNSNIFNNNNNYNSNYNNYNNNNYNNTYNNYNYTYTNNTNNNGLSQFHLLHHLSEKSSSVERGSESLDFSGQYLSTLKSTETVSENQSEQYTATLFFDEELGAMPLIGGEKAGVGVVNTTASFSSLQLQ